MKEKLQFKVAVENKDGMFTVSELFDSYDDAQVWRRQQEAEFLRAKPTAVSCRSNVIFVRTVEGA